MLKIFTKSIASPEDQKVTFVELFFDLVFVFSVTQVVELIHGGLDLIVIGQSVLIFWLVWWAWTQFTWTLNAADTTNPLVELGTLIATAVAFFMAVLLPDAFIDRGLWFALSYILVRGIGLGIYIWVASSDPSQRAAVRRFSLVSLGGLGAVLVGGIVGGSWQLGLWGLAILLDIAAALVGGQSEGWNLRPEHFVERYGLFVIITLGETLIVAASQVTNAKWTGDLVGVAVLTVGISCGFWWTYFAKVKLNFEKSMEARHGVERTLFGRDVFSLAHFPMVIGVIAYAGAINEALAHPTESLHQEWLLALAIGLVLFVGGTGVALWRATGQLPMPRLLISLGSALLIVLLPDVLPYVSMAIAFFGVALIAVVEQRAV